MSGMIGSAGGPKYSMVSRVTALSSTLRKQPARGGRSAQGSRPATPQGRQRAEDVAEGGELALRGGEAAGEDRVEGLGGEDTEEELEDGDLVGPLTTGTGYEGVPSQDGMIV